MAKSGSANLNQKGSKDLLLDTRISLHRSKCVKFNSTRLIVMLITINISFCLLSMPMSILQIVYYKYVNGLTVDTLKSFSNETNDNENKETLLDIIDFLHAIAEFLQFVNHSSNFFLYSLSGKTFRNQTKKFIMNKFILMKKSFKK